MKKMDKMASFLRRNWELFKFGRRQAIRRRKRTPIYWRSHLLLVSDDLKLMHEVDPEIVDEKFLEKNIQAYEELKKSNFKISVFLLGAIIFLVLSVFEIEFPISVFGFRLTATPGINEILIIVVSIVTGLTIGISIKLLTYFSTIKTLIPLVHRDGSKYFYLQFSNLEDTPSYYLPSLSPQYAWTKLISIANFVLILFLLIKIVGILTVSFVWRYFVYWEIWANPSLNAPLGKAAVSISLFVDAASLIVLLIYIIPLPHRDYTVNQVIEIAEQLGSEARDRAYRDVYGDEWDDENDMIEKGYLKKRE